LAEHRIRNARVAGSNPAAGLDEQKIFQFFAAEHREKLASHFVRRFSRQIFVSAEHMFAEQIAT
tara:strand:- start:7912 stop:8103 length:192 start_codon:yes stop_codon:yes gene_type:complete